MSASATVIASAAGAPPDGDFAPLGGRQATLTSTLLHHDRVLAEVARGTRTLSESFDENEPDQGPHFSKLQTALKIVLGLTETEWPEMMRRRYDAAMANAVAQFQLQNRDLPETGILDAATVIELDRRLTAIFCYDSETATIIHDASAAQYVGAYTAVLDEAVLRTRPEASASAIAFLDQPEVIPKGKAVFLIHLLDNKEWFWVETTGGIQGYLPLSQVWTGSPMPEPSATLVKIRPGDEIADIMTAHIQNERSALANVNLTAEQWKFYALATLRYNNPAGQPGTGSSALNLDSGRYDMPQSVEAGIYLANPGPWNPEEAIFGTSGAAKRLDQTATREAYLFYKAELNKWNTQNLRTRPGAFIWLPGIEHVDGLFREYEAGGEADVIGELRTKAWTVFDGFRERLEQVWDVGWGVRLDHGLGATFGIPIALDADHYSAVWRESETLVKVVRRGTYEAGFDVGVGVGFFCASEHNKGKMYGKDKNYLGVYALAGVQVGAGARLIVHQELEFPLDSNLAIAGLMMTALEAAPSMGGCARAFIMVLKLMGLDPGAFTTMLKVEPGGYARGKVDASLGIGFGDVPRSEPGAPPPPKPSWFLDNNTQDVRKGLALNMSSLWTLLFRTSLGISAGADTAFGMKMTHRNFDYDPTTGLRLPEKTVFEVYADAETQAGVLLPFFAQIAGWLRGISGPAGIGVGAKIVLEYYHNRTDLITRPDAKTGVHFDRFAVYTKQGDTDIYLGPASETELSLNVDVILKSLDQASTQDFSAALRNQSVADFFEGVKYRKITGISGIRTGITRKGLSSGRFFDNQKTLNTLIRHSDAEALRTMKGLWNATRFGLNTTALIDFELTPPMDVLTGLLSDIFEAVTSSPEFDIANLGKVLEILNPRTMPPELRRKISDLIDETEVLKLALHAEIGLVLGMGIYVATLAKLRLRLRGGLSAVYHLPLTEALIAEWLEDEFGADFNFRDMLKSALIAPPSPEDGQVAPVREKPRGIQ